MNEIDVHITATGEDAEMLTRCIRYLLDHSFMLRDKNEKMFNFANRMTNQTKLIEYFSVAGFRFFMEEKEGVCGIQPDEELGEEAGVKQLTQVRFTNNQYYVILVLWSIYIERTCKETCVNVTMGELVDELKTFDVDIKSRELHGILDKLRGYNLIDFRKPYTDDMEIRLYPSLMFGRTGEDFKVVMEDALKAEEDETDEDGEEAGTGLYQDESVDEVEEDE